MNQEHKEEEQDGKKIFEPLTAEIEETSLADAINSQFCVVAESMKEAIKEVSSISAGSSTEILEGPREGAILNIA
jgi:hypothetical protein